MGEKKKSSPQGRGKSDRDRNFSFRAPVTVTPQPLLIRNPKTFLLLAKSIKNVHTFSAAMMMHAKKEWEEREDFLLYALERQTGTIGHLEHLAAWRTQTRIGSDLQRKDQKDYNKRPLFYTENLM